MAIRGWGCCFYWARTARTSVLIQLGERRVVSGSDAERSSWSKMLMADCLVLEAITMMAWKSGAVKFRPKQSGSGKVLSASGKDGRRMSGC